MNFTREPVILSVITPKEGSKLVVRKSCGGEEEDYFLDALEIVTFEGAVFYRSTERPKSFLVPVSDYEVLELKETKIVLKNVSMEKSIKIAPSSNKPHQQPSGKQSSHMDKKQQRHLKRRRPKVEGEEKKEEFAKQPENNKREEVEQVSVLKKLIPPPNTLIKEKLARFKNEEFFEKNILPPTENETSEVPENTADLSIEQPILENLSQEMPENQHVEKQADAEDSTKQEKDIDS